MKAFCWNYDVLTRDGAIETLKKIRAHGDMNYILSSNNPDELQAFIKKYDLSSSVLSMAVAEWQEVADSASRSRGFKASELYQTAKLPFADLTIMIGCDDKDMKAVETAKRLLTREREYQKRVIGVLFDPDGKKADIPCGYRINELPQVLSLSF